MNRQEPCVVWHVQGGRLEKLAGSLEPPSLGSHPFSRPLFLSTYTALQPPGKRWAFCS